MMIHLFAGWEGHPTRGGMADYVGTFDTEEAAKHECEVFLTRHCINLIEAGIDEPEGNVWAEFVEEQDGKLVVVLEGLSEPKREAPS